MLEAIEMRAIIVRKHRTLFAFTATNPFGPGIMGWLRHVARNLELASEHGQSVDMVLMLVSDDDGVQRARIFSHHMHAAQGFTTGEAGIDENAGARAGDDCAVSLRTA